MRYTCLVTTLVILFNSLTAAAQEPDIATLTLEIEAIYAKEKPVAWGENLAGIITRLDNNPDITTNNKLLALTLDACGSPKGKGFDLALLDFLIKEQIPATLFINYRWLEANKELFKKLAANPLFEIANHGYMHKPASVNGRSVYGIDGTKDIAELVTEIELNARKITEITGKRPLFYRSGTAYYDEIAVRIANHLQHQVAGFSVLGDAGATYTAKQVKTALLTAKSGDIIIAHMNHPEAGTGAGIMAAIPRLKQQGFKFVRLSDQQTFHGESKR